MDLNISIEIEKIVNLSATERDIAINELSKQQNISVKAIRDTVNIEINKKNKVKRLARLARDESYLCDLFKLQGVKLPPDYCIENGYLCYSDDKKTIQLIKIFAITKILRVEKTYKYELSTNETKELIDGKDIIDNKQTAYHFADRGELITSNIMVLVADFIRKYLQLNEAIIPREQAYSTTGFHDSKYILPNRSTTFLDERITKRFTKKGTLEKEIEMMQLASKGKLIIPVLFGLIAPFTGILDIPLNFICHIGGMTGEGKSAAIKTAISLYGNKENSIYGKNFNSTTNGLETYLSAMKHVPGWVDEFEAAKVLLEAVAFMYMYSEKNGRGRARVNSKGEVEEREQKTFEGCLFTSGEKNISDIIKSLGKSKNMPLGLVRRTLDLESRELWSQVDKTKILDIIDNNFGNFVDFWIEHILNPENNITQKFYKILKKYKSLDGKEYLFALLELVHSELVDLKILTNESMKFIEDEFLKNEKAMESTKNIHLEFMENLLQFVASNRSKFVGIEDNNSNYISIFGKYKKDNNQLQIGTSIFNTFCAENGYVAKQILDLLLKNKICIGTHKSTTILENKMRIHEFLIDSKPIPIEYQTLDEDGEPIPF